MRLGQIAGPFTVTVFTSPTPLRAGPIDVSILVQDAHSGDVVTDAAITVALRANAQPSRTVSGSATRDQATNKLLYAALLELPAAGAWQVEIAIERADTTTTLAFAADAAPPLPPWRTYWPYFALPVIAIAVYGLHQWLVLRRQ
ncbi:MAG TPA: hypothetical protein VL049_04615 [Candidatus Dormibacteraeota bacterium]|nr:hypothetical protein [Candidatus Dormibacteraeota bacterium]